MNKLTDSVTVEEDQGKDIISVIKEGSQRKDGTDNCESASLSKVKELA